MFLGLTVAALLLLVLSAVTLLLLFLLLLLLTVALSSTAAILLVLLLVLVLPLPLPAATCTMLVHHLLRIYQVVFRIEIRRIAAQSIFVCFNGILIALHGQGSIPAVGVGAAEEVVGHEALVGGAVAVEIVGEGAGEAVVGEQAVGTVVGRQLVELAPHVVVAGTAGGA